MLVRKVNTSGVKNTGEIPKKRGMVNTWGSNMPHVHNEKNPTLVICTKGKREDYLNATNLEDLLSYI